MHVGIHSLSMTDLFPDSHEDARADTRKASESQSLFHPCSCVHKRAPAVHTKGYPTVTSHRLDIKVGADNSLQYLSATEDVYPLITRPASRCDARPMAKPFQDQFVAVPVQCVKDQEAAIAQCAAALP